MVNSSGLTPAVGTGSVLDRHDPFWPRICLAQLRGALALAPDVTDAHLKAIAQMAACQVASDLARRRWLARAQGNGPAGEQRLVPALRRCYLRRIESAIRRALHRGRVIEVACGGPVQEA
jgi:hypothetical protein